MFFLMVQVLIDWKAQMCKLSDSLAVWHTEHMIFWLSDPLIGTDT